jgi:5'-3' exoribonuclease 2
LEKETGHANFSAGPSQTLALTAPPTAPNIAPAPPPLHPSLPKRPTYDFAANADSLGMGAKPTAESLANLTTAAQALAGSNRDVVANRRAIRLANLSAAEVLKAELAGLSPVKPSAKPPLKPASLPPKPQPMQVVKEKDETNLHPMPPSSTEQVFPVPKTPEILPPSVPPSLPEDGPDVDADADGEPDPESAMETNSSGVDRQIDNAVEEILAGAKRKFEEGPGEPDVTEEDIVSIEEDEDDGDGDGVTSSLALKVNADGTVEQQDVVK